MTANSTFRTHEMDFYRKKNRMCDEKWIVYKQQALKTLKPVFWREGSEIERLWKFNGGKKVWGDERGEVLQ